jgi:DNA-binding NarL/FixJ family response regulator
MRVLLADDHGLLVEGLRNLLEAHGVEVVGVAKDGVEAFARARELRPDVILMDIRMPICDGLTATRLIKAELPKIKIVVLTTSSDESDLFEAVKSGANGYLLKSMDAESLIEALNDAQQDIPPFAPGLAARLLNEFARVTEPAPNDALAASGDKEAASTLSTPAPGLPMEALTARQAEVLALVAQGLQYKQVAQRVSLSPRTVKYHMAEIMRKLHVNNRAQVLAYAGSIGLGGETAEQQ